MFFNNVQEFEKRSFIAVLSLELGVNIPTLSRLATPYCEASKGIHIWRQMNLLEFKLSKIFLPDVKMLIFATTCENKN